MGLQYSVHVSTHVLVCIHYSGIWDALNKTVGETTEACCSVKSQPDENWIYSSTLPRCVLVLGASPHFSFMYIDDYTTWTWTRVWIWGQDPSDVWKRRNKNWYGDQKKEMMWDTEINMLTAAAPQPVMPQNAAYCWTALYHVAPPSVRIDQNTVSKSVKHPTSCPHPCSCPPSASGPQCGPVRWLTVKKNSTNNRITFCDSSSLTGWSWPNTASPEPYFPLKN